MMAKHHTLGLSGGTTGKQNRRHIVWLNACAAEQNSCRAQAGFKKGAEFFCPADVFQQVFQVEHIFGEW